MVAMHSCGHQSICKNNTSLVLSVMMTFFRGCGVSGKSPLYFRAVVTLKLLISFISHVVACSVRIVVKSKHTHTDRTTTITLAMHMHRGLIICNVRVPWFSQLYRLAEGSAFPISTAGRRFWVSHFYY